jgi:glucan endo-1,3-alpha-glucosidase
VHTNIVPGVSPWQYKDLNDGNPEDSWVSYSDTLFPDRFKQLVTDEFQPDIIELLTWNDFCESHYLRDLPSQDQSAKDYVELGDMGAYVWGQNHAPWRIIAKYYISWWKNGSPPAITMDQVVYWHRVHPKAAVCTGGASTSIRNFEYPVDGVFAWALVSEKSTISMTVGSNEFWTFEADNSGPTMNMVPFPADVSGSGITPQVAIMRGGQTIATGNSSQAISSNCAWQNFNPVVNLVGDGINAGI